MFHIVSNRHMIKCMASNFFFHFLWVVDSGTGFISLESTQ